MIKFFRHIRKELMVTGKTSKPALPAGRYLKYAIGEIALVMIGILLALQVNNWNEKRIQKQSEIKILNELLSDAEADTTFYTSRLWHLDQQLYSVSILNTLLLNINNDSISNLKYNGIDIYDASLAFQSTVISNFKNRIEDISNNKIQSILRAYSLAYHYLELHYAIKDEMYVKYVEELKLKYYKYQEQVSEKTTFGEYFKQIDFQKNEYLINFIRNPVENSKQRTEDILKINSELLKELEALLTL